MAKTRATALRFFEAKHKNVPSSLKRLMDFLDTAQMHGKVYVAVNTDVDVSGAIPFMKEHYPDVVAFPVTPWQKFVAPCNALVHRASMSDAEVLLSASTEFPLVPEYVEKLIEHLDADTLFVGARFSEHVFEEGEHVAKGAAFPWGSFGVWNLTELAKLGMPMAGDAPFDMNKAGVEEMSTVGLYQMLAEQRGFKALAKLVTVPDFYGEWNTDGWDESRHEAHQKKIASKSERPAEQLKWAGIKAPRVIHIA